MFKAKIVLSYDGSCFSGFAVQKGKINTVSNRLYEIFKALNINEKFNASGRTDKDVHALNQVLDINLPDFWSDLERLKKYINLEAHPSIHIKAITKVKSDFHARYSAKKRSYRYLLSTEEFTVFKSKYISYHDKIDLQKISSAIRLFEGVHNFEYFKKNGSDTTNFVREVYKCRFYKYKDIYVFSFLASGYLRSQIRMMVAFLLKISDGDLSEEELISQLGCKTYYNRFLAHPAGLYLNRIYY